MISRGASIKVPSKLRIQYIRPLYTDKFCDHYRTMTIQFISERGQPLCSGKITPNLAGAKCLLLRVHINTYFDVRLKLPYTQYIV